jgi:hypothetical protein
MKITIKNKSNQKARFQQFIFSFVNVSIINYFMKNNVTYFWFFSSIVGACFVMQILIGIFLILFTDNSIFFAHCDSHGLVSGTDPLSFKNLLAKQKLIEADLIDKVNILEDKLEECKKKNAELEAESRINGALGLVLAGIFFFMLTNEFAFPYF